MPPEMDPEPPHTPSPGFMIRGFFLPGNRSLLTDPEKYFPKGATGPSGVRGPGHPPSSPSCLSFPVGPATGRSGSTSPVLRGDVEVSRVVRVPLWACLCEEGAGHRRWGSEQTPWLQFIFF